MQETTSDQQVDDKLSKIDASLYRIALAARELNQNLSVSVPKFVEALERSRESQNTQRQP